MTAEVAVLNKSAVALAADSAMTVTVARARKTYPTNKLFALTKHHPIGIMIYNNAQFMDIPWETIGVAPLRRTPFHLGQPRRCAMAGRGRGRYPPEYKEQIVELVRAGRSPGSLAREFEPSEQTIRNWVKRADLDEGRRSDGLTTEARLELLRLKREVKRLRMERDILKKAAAWFARESDSIPSGGTRS